MIRSIEPDVCKQNVKTKALPNLRHNNKHNYKATRNMEELRITVTNFNLLHPLDAGEWSKEVLTVNSCHGAPRYTQIHRATDGIGD